MVTPMAFLMNWFPPQSGVHVLDERAVKKFLEKTQKFRRTSRLEQEADAETTKPAIMPDFV
jgi:hypothetical protein